MMDLDLFPDNETAQQMMSYIATEFYADSYVAKWLFQVMGMELTEAKTIFTKMHHEIFPETSTWALQYHEVKYGLPVREDLPIDERRRTIMMKRDGRLPMSPWRMEQMIQLLTGCSVSVDDSGAANTFSVTLSDSKAPLDFLKIRAKLKELKQSHVRLNGLNEEIKSTAVTSFGMAFSMSKTIENKIGLEA
jgi:hypothetical protein